MIRELLDTFAPTSLADMDQVRLMDRFDSKAFFHISQLPYLLAGVREHYSVLTIDGEHTFRYQTLYYDTPDKLLYHHHHSGRTNRYKVRFRQYVDTGSSFLEVKFKNNKGLTTKRRIATDGIYKHLRPEDVAFLSQHTPLQLGDLKPTLSVSYQRITLVGRHHPERVTIDLGLSFQGGDRDMAFDQVVIMEMKRSRSTGRSPMQQLLHERHIPQLRISKYATGVACCIDGVKTNLYKPTLLQLFKINSQCC